VRIFGFTRYGGPEVAALREVPAPEPGPGEVLVAMRAAGVNPADVKVRSGARRDQVEVRFPMAMGREAAGVVVATGAGASDFSAGDEVFGAVSSGSGALAELVLLEASGTARRPPSLSWEQVASIPVSVGTAFDCLHQLDLPSGSTLVVVGAGGGVGSSALQLARARGLQVVGVASAAKSDLVERLGGRPVASGPGWPDRVASAAPDGVDGLLDLVGGEACREGRSLLADGSRLVSLATPALAAELGGGGVTRRRTTAVFGEVAGLAARGELAILVDAAFPLEESERAVALVESGHAAGNVVVLGPLDPPAEG
jgi:NADPH:quinone reductase-like Zn-dependent oxidoreductase